MGKRSVKDKKLKKDGFKILLTVLLCLLVIEIILIPCLVYAEVKKILPVIGFLVLPTVSAIIILLLSRNCSRDYTKKLERISSK